MKDTINYKVKGIFSVLFIRFSFTNISFVKFYLSNFLIRKEKMIKSN